ncbi:class I SAM-dependent methyltransferase [Ahrensia marina]|uniref:class I SAM-dependent methyltransferase n=1 Tax=Ahrensia marina TaxID=1514904 RepID=UPI0035CFCD13
MRFDTFVRLKYGSLFETWADTHRVSLAKCNQCGHRWYPVVPNDEVLAKMYETALPLKRTAGDGQQPTKQMVARMRQLRGLAGQEARLLDFGSGNCRWARAAIEAGFQVTAFEPNKNRGSIANSEENFLFVSDYSALIGSKFDVIHVEQVLEHLSRPFDVLTGLKKLINPHGLIIVRVPNVAKEEILRPIWETWPFDGTSPHVMAPFEHIQGYTPRSLEALVNRAGFEALPLFKLALYMPKHVLHRLASHIHPSVGQTQIVAIKK